MGGGALFGNQAMITEGAAGDMPKESGCAMIPTVNRKKWPKMKLF